MTFNTVQLPYRMKKYSELNFTNDPIIVTWRSVSTAQRLVFRVYNLEEVGLNPKVGHVFTVFELLSVSTHIIDWI